MIIKIYISYSFLKLDADDKQQFSELKEKLYDYYSVEDKEHNKRIDLAVQEKKYERFFLKDEALLGIGFLNSLKRYLSAKKIKFEIIDIRKRNKIDVSKIDWDNLLPKKYKIRDYQREAVEKFFTVGDMTGLLEGSVASGKTLMFALIAKILNVRTLILVDQIGLAHQGRSEFINEYGFREMDVGIVQGKNIMEKKITFATIQSITKLNEIEKYQFVIVDEVHGAKANTFQGALMQLQCPYRLGVSGTISGLSIYEFSKVKAYIGDIFFKITTKELVKKEVLAKPYIYSVRVNGSPDGRLKYSRNWPEIVSNLLANNEERNQMIVDIVKRAPKPALILITSIEHGENLKLMLGKKAAFVWGDTENDVREFYRKKIDKGMADIVIASNIWNKGTNMKKLKTLVIAGGMKSYVLVKQRAGRGLRKTKGKEKIHIIDFLDYSNVVLTKQSKKRFSIYAQDGFNFAGEFDNPNEIVFK